MIPPGAGTRGGRLRDPREAITQLRQQLALHWPGRVYQSDSRGLSVLSITPELTVWCNGRDFVWYEQGRPTVHPASDPVTAAVRLIGRLRQLSEHDSGGAEPRTDSGAEGGEAPGTE
ncbi:MAG TPA: hypothetical protein VFU43_23650 [Streptosporangiaceae bacterium]|nr:hypothetical protein [Streptosporangiaceae bacterium]